MKIRTSNALVGIVASLLVVMIPLTLGCGARHEVSAPSGEAPTPVEVTLAQARLQPLDGASALTGSVRARRQVSPGSKILGRVEEVRIREGERVSRGGLLARLENRDLEASVAQAEAAVAMAEAQLENAKAQRERMDALVARGSATPKNQEDAVAAYRVADAALAQAKANLASAQVSLDYSEIRSPIAGWVVERRIEAGDMASPGVPMFVVEDLSRVQVEVQVPEAQVVHLERGESARVRVLDRELEAEIELIVPSGDPASRTFTVKLELDNPGGFLRSGMFARVSFASDVQQGLAVESSAVVRRGQLDGLFVAGDDGLLRLRWIKTGSSVGERVEVLSGLEEGERYVVSPPPGLADGTPFETGGAS